MNEFDRIVWGLVSTPFKVFFGLIFKINIMRPSEDNWPPLKIGAYDDATAVPEPSAKVCHYRMRSQHKRFNKTITVWRIGFVTVSTAPYFYLRRVFLAFARCFLLAGVAVVGLRVFLWPLGQEFDFGLGPVLRQESPTAFAIHAYFIQGLDGSVLPSKAMGLLKYIEHQLALMVSTFDFTLPAALTSLSHFAAGYGLILLWAVVLAVMVGLAVNAVMWLGLGLWAAIPRGVESVWLAHMRRQERDYGYDLGKLGGGVDAPKPAGPTSPYDDDDDVPAGRRAFGRVAVAGVGVVALVGVAVAAATGALRLPVVSVPSGGPVPASAPTDSFQQVPEGFRDPSHWMHDRRAGCLIYHPAVVGPNESVTWSGACADGFATGRGVAVWSENGKDGQRDEATLDHGLRNGPAVLRFPDGTAYRDRYDHGKRMERQKISP